MKRRGDSDACHRTEHKDMTDRLRNLQTGEVGTVIQCAGWDTPGAYPVRVGDEVASRVPEKVEAVETDSALPEEGASHEKRPF